MLLAVGLVGDAVAVAGVLMGLSGHVDFAKTWGALGLLVGVLSICILYLSDPPKARRETRAMGPSETPLRKSSGRRGGVCACPSAAKAGAGARAPATSTTVTTPASTRIVEASRAFPPGNDLVTFRARKRTCRLTGTA